VERSEDEHFQDEQVQGALENFDGLRHGGLGVDT
jgi:hypothetical protein